MTNKRWIALFCAVLVLCAAALILQRQADRSDVITISQDGKILQAIDLTDVKDPYSITVSYRGSTNTILISQETVVVSHADCANQICVDHGPLLPGGSPITCLPNRLIIQWAEQDIDG